MIRLTRRAWLAGALASTLLPRPAWGRDLPRLGDGLRADPDFDALLPTDPRVVGVRPHRVGGIRLELEEAPLEGTSVRLVHHYGHGGGGITLAWGCAAVAAELVAKALGDRRDATVGVVGAGVIGLATAQALRERWPRLPLTVYARDLDLRSTTSWNAGGQFEPSGIWREYVGRKPLLDHYVQGSEARIMALQRDGLADRYGVAERDRYVLEPAHPGPPAHAAVLDPLPYRSGRLPFSKLDAPGRQDRVWLVNPRILLPRLTADLTATNVRFQARTLTGRADLARLPHDVVVNCTGFGAKALVGDEALVPQRGHLVLLNRTKKRQDWFFSGGCANGVLAYVFCRHDDIVVGGTLQTGRGEPTAGPDDGPVFDRILANARGLFAGHPDSCVAPG